MTYHYPPYPPYPPPSPIRRGPNYTKVIALAAVGVFVFVLILVLAVFVYHHNNAASTAGGSHTSTAQVTKSDQWFAAVCKPGLFGNDAGNGLLSKSRLTTETPTEQEATPAALTA